MPKNYFEILSTSGKSHYLEGSRKLKKIHESISESIYEKNVAISGASGWIGRNFLPRLSTARNLTLFSRTARKLRIEKNEYVTQSLPLSGYDLKADIFFDTAFKRQDEFHPDRQFESEKENDALLHFSKEVMSNAKVGVYVGFSSGAATIHPPTVYGAQKAKLEDMFEKHARTSDRMLRIWSMTGRFTSSRERFAVVSFITQAISTEQIEIEASVPVYRSYAHIDELLAISTHPDSQNRIVNSGGKPIEVAELANKIQNLLSFEVQIIKRPKKRETEVTEDIYIPPFDESGKVLRDIGIEPLTLDEQLAVMIVELSLDRQIYT